MHISELLSQAREIIDTPQGFDEDHVIAPTEHAELYRESAPSLAEILSGSHLVTASEQCEQSDSEAIIARERYKKTAEYANHAVFITVISAAVLLLVMSVNLPFVPEF